MVGTVESCAPGGRPTRGQSVHIRILFVALVALVLAAPVCGPTVFVAISPQTGQVIAVLSFPVQVEINTSVANPSTLEVTLNDVPLAMAGGPAVWTATVNAGGPVLDDNVLKARVKLNDGTPVARQVQFQYQPPKARARKITNPADLIEGPLAHGRVGDYVIENAVARFVIQDGPKRDIYSVGQFGGNVIDAERVVSGVRQGNDNFFEMQPGVNIETVINADVVEVVNDGQNALPAVVRACGPDDLIDFINASSAVADFGLPPPAGTDDNDMDLEGCTTYTLTASDSHLSVQTTLTYNSGPNVNLFSGDYLNGAGELEQWTSNSAILGASRQGIGEMLANASFDVFSYFGFGQGLGTSYGVLPRPVAGAFVPVSSSFSTSGVSYVLAGSSIPLVLAGFTVPTFGNVPAGASRSFTRLFQVADGSPSRLVDLQLALDGFPNEGTLQGVVRVGGVPVPGARVVAGPLNPAQTEILEPSSIWVTDANGFYSGKLVQGTYGVAASLQGALYEPGGPTATKPKANVVSITASNTTTKDVALPATGRVRVNVVDHLNAPLPARVSVVGFDPSPEIPIPFAEGPVSGTTGLFRDVTKDSMQYGITWVAYAGANGVAEFNLEPGTYEIFVSRGTEYSLFQQSTVVGSGPFGTVTNTVNAQLVKVLDTTGFISSDYHVHMLDSPDSRINRSNRVHSMAGEGVDNLIITDHDALPDPAPLIASLGLAPFLHSTIGEEITSFDYGHFNAYPQARDPVPPSGGSTDFGGAAPVGDDFPSKGHFNLTPAQLQNEAKNKLKTGGGLQNAGLTTVVHVNHIDSHFQPLQINTAAQPPTSLSGASASFFRLDPMVPNFFNANFEGLELWNGSGRGDQDQFLFERMGIWMNLLNQGIPMTFIADTDTHTFFDLETAGARTWTPTSTGSDAPNQILDNDIGTAIDAGKALGGQGIYVKTRLVDTETTNEANFEWSGSTLVTATDGTVNLEIDVQAPTWASYDRIEIYTNAQTCKCTTARCNGIPVGTRMLYGALPSQVLTLGGGGFTVTTEPGLDGGQRRRTQKTVSLGSPTPLTQDTWVVVVVKGTVNASPPMFPVYPRNLTSGDNPNLAALLSNTVSEAGTRALGATNALYLDVDGNAAFDAPGCAGRCNVSLCP